MECELLNFLTWNTWRPGILVSLYLLPKTVSKFCLAGAIPTFGAAFAPPSTNFVATYHAASENKKQSCYVSPFWPQTDGYMCWCVADANCKFMCPLPSLHLNVYSSEQGVWFITSWARAMAVKQILARSRSVFTMLQGSICYINMCGSAQTSRRLPCKQLQISNYTIIHAVWHSVTGLLYRVLQQCGVLPYLSPTIAVANFI